MSKYKFLVLLLSCISWTAWMYPVKFVVELDRGLEVGDLGVPYLALFVGLWLAELSLFVGLGLAELFIC